MPARSRCFSAERNDANGHGLRDDVVCYRVANPGRGRLAPTLPAPVPLLSDGVSGAVARMTNPASHPDCAPLGDHRLRSTAQHERAASADQFCQRGNAIAAFTALDDEHVGFARIGPARRAAGPGTPFLPRARESERIRAFDPRREDHRQNSYFLGL